LASDDSAGSPVSACSTATGSRQPLYSRVPTRALSRCSTLGRTPLALVDVSGSRHPAFSPKHHTRADVSTATDNSELRRLSTMPVSPHILPAVNSLDVFKADIFQGKVLFCTGGGSGICKGMTEAIMAHGASAAIVGRKCVHPRRPCITLLSRTSPRSSPKDPRSLALFDALSLVIHTTCARSSDRVIVRSGWIVSRRLPKNCHPRRSKSASRCRLTFGSPSSSRRLSRSASKR
jgi:hypothetical protein